MNPILLELLPLIKQGYCCSQLLMHLVLQGAGHENSQLIRAMHGLCFGMGGTEGPCGLLTGGACVLACFAGKGQDNEDAHPNFSPMVNEYHQWFIEYVQCSGLCHAVMENLGHILQDDTNITKEHEHLRCGQLLGICWEKILELLDNYNIELELKA